MKIELYGAANTPNGLCISHAGEVTLKDLNEIASTKLSWEGLDLKSSNETEEESECNWLVEIDGKSIPCETNRELQAVVKTLLVIKGEL